MKLPHSNPPAGDDDPSGLAAKFDRRDVLRGLGALGAWSFLPSAARLSDEGPTLVLLQLTGGNDGLSTVVPYADDAYRRARPTIAHDEKAVLALDDYRGLHPALEFLRRTYDQGGLAIVEGVGYPDPIRSHFKSFDVWHTADPRGRSTGEGWIGRCCAASIETESRVPELVVHVGRELPFSLHSERIPAVAFRTPEGYRWLGTGEELVEVGESASEGAPKKEAEPESSGRDAVLERLSGVLHDAHESSTRVRGAVAAYRPRAEYPRSEFANSLRTVAALVDARIGTRVASVELRGFDTHGGQKTAHDNLMRALDQGLAAFVADLEKHGNGGRVVVMAFSEFGRRVKENASRGTDHGTAGPMFVLGAGVRGGLHGRHSSLAELDDGDLVHTTDFRSVYTSVIGRCLGPEAARTIVGAPPALDLFA